MSLQFQCQALVLSSVDYGESDRVVTLLTQDRGRLAAFARGARKSKRRFVGALEPFTLFQAQLSETRGETFRLDGADVLDSFAGLRTEIKKTARAFYAAELTRELSREQEPQPELFELLFSLLGKLAREEAGGIELILFELGALASAGFMPRFDSCSCGGKPDFPLFDSASGGLLCRRCAFIQRHESGQASSILPMSPEASRALVTLQRYRGENRERENLALVSVPARKEVRSLLSSFVSHHVGRRLKSLDFMHQVGIEHHEW